jgi:cyanophycin synthetase
MRVERVHDSELAGLVSLVAQARNGDVVAIMTHQDRELLDRWLIDHGATRDSTDVLGAKVVAARGDQS